MGTKAPFQESPTKITSSSEIDKILKQARTVPAPVFDDDDDDVGDFEEHTQIGNVAELAARSMTIEDPTPPAPVVSRASTNVIRRNTPLPMTAVRPPSASESTPMPRAQGSLSEMTPPPLAKTDDDAFDPWDEQPVASASQPMQAITADVIEEAPRPVMQLPLAAPPIETTIVEAPTPVPIVKAEPVARKSRWGLIAWVALLAVFATVCTIGYMRIAQLEEQLAQAKAQAR